MYPPMTAVRAKMDATGIGYAGIEGVWWLPACQPFVWPQALQSHLADIGAALFHFLDGVWTVLKNRSDPELAAQLRHKVPARLLACCHLAPVLSVRPDFQLVPTPDPARPLRPVLTEIEIAPSAQGFAHAMQVGYGLPTDLADCFATFLAGRTLLFVGTAQWSEFLFEQLAFCRALAERGATAFVLYDRSLQALTAEIAQGKRWVPPLFGVPTRPASWNLDLPARLRRQGLEAFWREEWPEQVGSAVLFRFGYLENFSSAQLAQLAAWQAHGATFLNPLAYPLDSKVLLAALQRPSVRDQIPAAKRALLDDVIPATHLLTPALVPQLQQEQEAWLVKYAGFDGGGAAWGGRSVEIGLEQSAEAWSDRLASALELPWPVVAQRLTPSARLSAEAARPDGTVATHTGSSRLRAFFLRTVGGETHSCGAHVTLSAGLRVAEGTESVQGPVAFLPAGGEALPQLDST